VVWLLQNWPYYLDRKPRVEMKTLNLTTLLALALALGSNACYLPRKIFPLREKDTARTAHRPKLQRPTDKAGAAIFDAAGKVTGRRILVSIRDRHLWLLEGSDTIFTAPAAVGMDESFTFRGQTFRFHTPRGRHTIRSKESDPRWVPPDWHYFEIAADKGLEPVHLRRGQRVRLKDGTTIVVRGDQVGYISGSRDFEPFAPEYEIIFDAKIFIPPFGTEQRAIPKVLGTHKLDLGDGYLSHGTNEEDSIGRPVTHGCIRLHNKDVARLYQHVPEGTPVFIF
jgi:hypothetical protein